MWSQVPNGSLIREGHVNLGKVQMKIWLVLTFRGKKASRGGISCYDQSGEGQQRYLQSKENTVLLFGHKEGEIFGNIEINTLGPGLGSGDGNSDLHKKRDLNFTLSFFFLFSHDWLQLTNHCYCCVYCRYKYFRTSCI